MDDEKKKARELAIASAIQAAAVAAVESCREDGESDMRTARGRINGIDLAAEIAAVP